MPYLSTICVYCGAAPGSRPEYREAAALLGGEIARRGLRLVYGGGSVGLMGALADGALAAGGRVTGVITQQLMDRELGHRGVHALEVVDSMHDRKARMATLADAFITLPGGVGTLDEMFEILAWYQLSLHTKPVGLLNVAGYFDPLLDFLDHAAREDFLRIEPRRVLRAAATSSLLLDELARA